MSNRKKISPEIRKAVYDKYNRHCAYCGCVIDYKNMQVDHLIPLRNWDGSHTEEELWSIENLMPSCRQCNHYKRANTLQDFREAIEQIPFKLNRDSSIYRIGIKYGMIEIKEHPVLFYFEKVKLQKNKNNNNSYYGRNITLEESIKSAQILRDSIAKKRKIKDKNIKKFNLK